MSEQPQIEFHGELSEAAIEQLADLLLSSSPDCELCGQRPAEHFVDSGQWAGRHVCAQCWESLPVQHEDQTDAE